MAIDRPVNLEEILRGARVPIDLPPSMARGVDLNIIRDKRKHQHRYCALGRFLLMDDQMVAVHAQVDAANALYAAQKASGGEVAPVPIDVPLDGDKMVGIDGPGCMKCGSHSTDPVKGYGKLCEKSDDEFADLVALFEAHATVTPTALRVVDGDGATDA